MGVEGSQLEQGGRKEIPGLASARLTAGDRPRLRGGHPHGCPFSETKRETVLPRRDGAVCDAAPHPAYRARGVPHRDRGQVGEVSGYPTTSRSPVKTPLSLLLPNTDYIFSSVVQSHDISDLKSQIARAQTA